MKKIIDLMRNFVFLASCFVALSVGAADSADKSAADKQSMTDKLVANQAAAKPAASTDPAANKPMTINFSDFVKDGAGCGVPNLDTSGK